MQHMQRIWEFCRRVLQVSQRALRSPRTFYVVVGLLVLEAAWIAFTARYPQAFDENYHLGLIKLHAQQLLPFFTAQPDGPALYGALAHDPSYLYHYLMAIPYKLVVLLTDSETIQIIILRLVNIGLFVVGLFVYRKLLTELGVSRGLRNTVFLFFVLLPVVPLLAAQINYDNLIFIATGLLFLYVARWLRLVNEMHKPKDVKIPFSLAAMIVIIGSLGSVVKFSFVPLFAASVVVCVVTSVGTLRRLRSKLGQVKLFRQITFPRRSVTILLSLLLVVSLGLCVERYAVNLIQFHNPVPKCEKVLGVEECQDYSPWARDYLFASTYPRPKTTGILVYPLVWVHRMVYETMFTIGSYIYNSQGLVYYEAKMPLGVANITAWVIVAAGAICIVLFFRQIISHQGLAALLTISAFYILVLFMENFSSYRHTGEVVAVHGRYLVPFYPVLLLTIALGYKAFIEWVGRVRRITRVGISYLKTGLVVVTLLFFLQGAGISVWIVRSSPQWYWQQSRVSQDMNWYGKNVLNRLIPFK